MLTCIEKINCDKLPCKFLTYMAVFLYAQKARFCLPNKAKLAVDKTNRKIYSCDLDNFGSHFE